MTEVATTATGRHRRSRQRPGPRDPIDTWPPAWCALATLWARRLSGGNLRCKWDTLLSAAGGAAFETAHDLLEALLGGGWIGVDEAWQDGRWQPLWIEFVALPELRQALGLPAPGARLAATLQARANLLTALERWSDYPERPEQATRRDFSQFARGDTKGITAAEWDWLDAQVDLAACGIANHAPLLCIAAPLVLQMPRGQLNLAVAPDFLALPPSILEQCSAVSSAVTLWSLVENRTSFERVARGRQAGEGVIWLPGFPPGWWQTAIARLLQLAPAPARIACDPDPAGIEIALHAGTLWHGAGLAWQPWRMSPGDLASLTQRKPLNDHDRARLAALGTQALPPELDKLAAVLAMTGEKGEQEGYL
ncbi:MAG: hypothetical protein Q8L93_11260 [Rhodocyclaceae bacterium]|nr:hypothetical protein [Rhodocyclaceae bacterium]